MTNNQKGQPKRPEVRLWREAARLGLSERLERVFSALDNLKDREFLDYYLKIVKEVMPPPLSEPDEGQQEQTAVSIFKMVYDKIQADLERKAS